MAITLRAALLIVSTTASEDPATDRCESSLREVFEDPSSGTARWELSDVKIVSDDVLQIQRAITSWIDSNDPVNLIITSGGTGFANKDVTPEAVSPLLHKHAPGLVHGMLAASLAVTPFAIMSRPVAGVRNRSLILTLPGSPSGARENLEAVVKLLPHACVQAAGADSRELHAGGTQRLEREAGVAAGSAAQGGRSAGRAHDHGHGHGHHLSLIHI